jgi:hypothetical protein
MRRSDLMRIVQSEVPDGSRDRLLAEGFCILIAGLFAMAFIVGFLVGVLL